MENLHVNIANRVVSVVPPLSFLQRKKTYYNPKNKKNFNSGMIIRLVNSSQNVVAPLLVGKNIMNLIRFPLP
jgi:hypothetical protein